MDTWAPKQLKMMQVRPSSYPAWLFAVSLLSLSGRPEVNLEPSLIHSLLTRAHSPSLGGR
jgi:hypothetical protein